MQKSDIRSLNAEWWGRSKGREGGRWLLRCQGQGQGLRPEQSQDSGLGQMQAQSLDLRPARGPGRGHEQMPDWTQEQRHERGPGRYEGQMPERGLVLGLERAQEQRQGPCLGPTLLMCPERRHDRRLLRGQGLPQPSGG